MRIGIVGIENSHADHVVEHLNARQAFPGAQVTALAGGPAERAAALAAAGGIEHVVDTVEELLPLADALVVCDRDGALHRAHAEPFLTAGRPVLVDKPLACSVADAEAILAAAAAGGARLTSYSPLRYAPDVSAVQAELAAAGPVRAVVATGPADPASEHGGIFFYGIHPVDVALRLAPGPVGDVRVDRVAESVVASATIGAARVTVNLMLPDGSHRVPFHVAAVTRGTVVARTVDTAGNYVAPGLDAFLAMAAGGAPPISPADLLRPIRFLEQVQTALRALG